jgi:hypothetical protein
MINNFVDPITYQSQQDPPTSAVKADAPAEAQDPKRKKRNDVFRQWKESTKAYRRRLVQNWSISIDYRRNKPFATDTDDDIVAVPLDWSMTKTKQAALFSQVPKVRVDHFPDTLGAPFVPQYERKLNDTLVLLASSRPWTSLSQTASTRLA